MAACPPVALLSLLFAIGACETPGLSNRRLVLYSNQVDLATAISRADADRDISLGTIEADSVSRLRIHVRLAPDRLAAGSRVELTTDGGHFASAAPEALQRVTVDVLGDSATATLIAATTPRRVTVAARVGSLTGTAHVDFEPAWPDTILLWSTRSSASGNGRDSVVFTATLYRRIGRVSTGLLAYFRSDAEDRSAAVVVTDGRSAVLTATSPRPDTLSWFVEMGQPPNSKRSGRRTIVFDTPPR